MLYNANRWSAHGNISILIIVSSHVLSVIIQYKELKLYSLKTAKKLIITDKYDSSLTSQLASC